MPTFALHADRVFTGEHFVENLAVLVEGDRVAGLVPPADLPAGLPRIRHPAAAVVPGWIDLQVNGGGGVLFNEERGVDGVRRLARAFAPTGTTALLPTFVTDRPDRMVEAIRAAAQALHSGVPGVVGLHLEGPFLAVARKGAHDPALIRPMAEADVDLLLDTGIDRLLLTVAPETVPPHLIRRLVEGGVIVSLGHSDASYEVAMAAADAGARGVTHLFNAMSQLNHRAPGLVGAALDHGGLWSWIIADGHHVAPAALRAAIAAKRGPAKLMLVTDAMPPAGAPGDTFSLNGRTVRRRDGRLTLEDGTLAGSDLTMDQAIRIAVRTLGVPLAEALRMASLYPAQFLRIDDRYGRIAPGYRADLVVLGDDMAVRETRIGGVAV